MNKMNKNRFFVLTGVNTSGKSSIVKILKQKNIYNLKILELDDKPVPKVGRTYWQDYRIEELIVESRDILQNSTGKVLIAGVILPHRIEISKRFVPELFNPAYILLNLDKDTLYERLHKRHKNDNTLSQDYLSNLYNHNLHIKTILYNETFTRKFGYLLNTSDTNIEDNVNAIVDILKK